LHATFDGLQRGVIVVESIWPNSAFEGGIGINSLVGADPGAPNGGAACHDNAVWVRPNVQGRFSPRFTQIPSIARMAAFGLFC